jgi:hypothetical protein
MTAVTSSVASIIDADLTNAILRLPEEDFWKLVETRLNLPPQRNQIITVDANELSHLSTGQRNASLTNYSCN